MIGDPLPAVNIAPPPRPRRQPVDFMTVLAKVGALTTATFIPHQMLVVPDTLDRDRFARGHHAETAFSVRWEWLTSRIRAGYGPAAMGSGACRPNQSTVADGRRTP